MVPLLRRGAAVTAFAGDRPGAALVVAIVVLVLIGCLSTALVQQALLETRVAANADLALRMRLHAEAAAARLAADWPAAVESLAVHGRLRVQVDTTTEASVERIGGMLHLVRAATSASAGLPGRASAALLVLAPAIAPAADPGAAAIAATAVTVLDGGAIDGRDAACAGDAMAILLPEDGRWQAAGTGTVTGGIAVMEEGDHLHAGLPRLFTVAAATPAGAGISFHPGDLRLAGPFNGVLLVAGSLVLAEGAAVNGLVATGGDLDVQARALVAGAAYVVGSARVGGTIRRDACAARAAAATARLDRPLLSPRRAGVPAF
jgi:hypothetical protein